MFLFQIKIKDFLKKCIFVPQFYMQNALSMTTEDVQFSEVQNVKLCTEDIFCRDLGELSYSTSTFDIFPPLVLPAVSSRPTHYTNGLTPVFVCFFITL